MCILYCQTLHTVIIQAATTNGKILSTKLVKKSKVVALQKSYS